MSAQIFDWDMFCDYCKKETTHLVETTGHERDSSGDKETCKECGSYRFGLSDTLWCPDGTLIERD